MRTRNTRMGHFAMQQRSSCWRQLFPSMPWPNKIECSSPVRNVAGVTNPAGHVITTKYQFDNPNLQTLLTTTISSGQGCLVAHLSGWLGLRTITSSSKCAWMGCQ